MSWLSKYIFKSKQSQRLGYWLFVAVSVLAALFVYHTFGFVQMCGWIGSLAFAFSALPQALMSWRDKHSRGVADGTMLLWGIGEVTMLVYGFGIMQWPIIFNCLFNTIYITVIIYYRLWPKD